MASKGGRPFIVGAVRYACGKINKAETDRRLAEEGKQRAKQDEGTASPRVGRNKDIWSARCFKGGGQGNHAGDAVGQMWLLGLLDVDGLDETCLLNAVRAWWHGRGVMFKGMDYKTARFERQSQSSSLSTALSKPEREYIRYNRMLLDASDYEMDCLADLMETTVDDNFPSWVARVIQTELLNYIRLPVIALKTNDDQAKFEAAKRAMISMAGAEAVKKSAA